MEEAGRSEEAALQYAELGSYEDAAQRRNAIEYALAVRDMERDPEAALARFENLGKYQDAQEQAKACRYALAAADFEAGDYDIALVGVNLSEVPDLSQMFRSGGSINLNNYGNEEMKALLEQLSTAQTEAELKSLYSQIQMNVVERLPVLGMLFRTGTVLSTRSLAGLSGIRVENTLNGIEFMSKGG